MDGQQRDSSTYLPGYTLMLDITYLYHLPTADIPVTGFIAYLLQLGDAWDIRCLEG